jgi:hypothetical protein
VVRGSLQRKTDCLEFVKNIKKILGKNNFQNQYKIVSFLQLPEKIKFREEIHHKVKYSGSNEPIYVQIEQN